MSGKIPTVIAVGNWLHYVQRAHTKRTHEHYSMAIKRFCADAPAAIDEISIEHIECHVDKLLERGKRRTANSHLTAVKSFTHWCSDRYDIPNPARSVKMLVEDPPKQRVLSEEEYQGVLAVAEGIDRDIIEFIGNTGVRRGEFLAMNWRDVSPDMQFLRIFGKGRKQRVVPLNNTCRQILDQYKGSNGDGTIPIAKRYPSKEGIYWMCRKLHKKADIPLFGTHAIRHYFATKLIRKGVQLIKVSKILGHCSVKVTESIYIHLMPIDLLGVTDVLDD
jgi:integrase